MVAILIVALDILGLYVPFAHPDTTSQATP